MASYDIGGVRSFGGYATGLKEPTKWVSLGDHGVGLAKYDDTKQYALDIGAYTGGSAGKETPDAFIPLANDKGVYVGYYYNFQSDDYSLSSVIYCLSTDETVEHIYTRTGFNPPAVMSIQDGYSYGYFYIGSDNYLYYGVGMSEVNVGLLTVEEFYEKIADNTSQFCSPVVSVPIRDSHGVNLADTDLDLIPDDSTPGGGGGNWDNDSDVIPYPDLPVLGAVNSGFLTVYNPSISEIQGVGTYLWSSAGNIWQNIMNYQTNVLDLIVSLSVVPVDPISEMNTEIKIGGVGTGVTSALVSEQYMILDCGTFNVQEYYGNALDYGQYTRIFCQLPFIGARELKTDEVMDGSVSIRYNIDLVTGACVALIRCNRHGLDAVLYQFEGNLSMQIPIVSRDFMGMYQGILTAGIGMAGGAISGGAGGAISSGLSSAMNVMSLKPQVHHSGNLSANGGFLGVHVPYLIIERPIQSVPSQSQSYYGAPSNIRAKLGDLKGYTECEAPIIDIDCTSEERELIKTYLEEGIIL